MKDPSSNIRKIAAFKFLDEFLIIAPILVPFYRAHDLSAAQILVVQAIFSLSMLLFEIPSGYFSDVLGRRKTLIICAVFLPLGLLVYSFSRTFGGFVLAEILLGVSYSMRSGTDSALLYDSLLQLNRQDSYKKYEGRTIFFERLGSALSSVAGGACAAFSLRFPFYLNTFVSIFILPVSFSLVEPERKTRKSDNPWTDLAQIVRIALTNRKIIPVLLFSSMLATTGIISVWGYFMLFAAWKVPLFWYGIYFAGFQMIAASSAWAAHRAERLLGRKISLYLLFAIPISQGLIGWINSPGVVILMLLHAFLWGMATPIFLDILNRLIESEVRATILSVSGMIGRIFFVVIAPLFGLLIDRGSLLTAFLCLSVCFTLIALPAAYLLGRSRD